MRNAATQIIDRLRAAFFCLFVCFSTETEPRSTQSDSLLFVTPAPWHLFFFFSNDAESDAGPID